MDDRKFTTYVEPRRVDTYFASRTTSSAHRCYFGGSNRCSCGKHREPAFATGISATGTDKERLSIEL
jgi:hypothetical protein